jgi:trehalose 6-phosphate synthase/phosphatase
MPTPALLARRGAPRERGRLLLVSNRLPMTMSVQEGALCANPSSGGLATGLRGVHEETGGIWIGWPGLPIEKGDAIWPGIQRTLGASRAVGVRLSEHELDGFYSRFSNGALWPVLHDRVEQPAPDVE